MAISIAYGIGLATILTLVMLPLMLKLSNDIKVLWQWYTTGVKPNSEAVEGAVIELKSEEDEK